MNMKELYNQFKTGSYEFIYKLYSYYINKNHSFTHHNALNNKQRLFPVQSETISCSRGKITIYNYNKLSYHLKLPLKHKPSNGESMKYTVQVSKTHFHISPSDGPEEHLLL